MHMPDLSRARWRKSSFSQANGACVEVARSELAVGMRDTKDRRSGPALLVEPAAFTAFLRIITS